MLKFASKPKFYGLCPLCGIRWKDNIIVPFANDSVEGKDDAIRHLVYRCEIVKEETKNKINEMKVKNVEFLEKNKLYLDKIEINELCIVADYICQKLGKDLF